MTNSNMKKLQQAKNQIAKINEISVLKEEKFKDHNNVRKPSFDESHVRVTTYLLQNVHKNIMHLKKTKKISSITSLYNAALIEYIKKYFM